MRHYKCKQGQGVQMRCNTNETGHMHTWVSRWWQVNAHTECTMARQLGSVGDCQSTCEDVREYQRHLGMQQKIEEKCDNHHSAPSKGPVSLQIICTPSSAGSVSCVDWVCQCGRVCWGAMGRNPPQGPNPCLPPPVSVVHRQS